MSGVESSSSDIAEPPSIPFDPIAAREQSVSRRVTYGDGLLLAMSSGTSVLPAVRATNAHLSCQISALSVLYRLTPSEGKADVNDRMLSLVNDALESGELPPTPDETVLQVGLAALGRDGYVQHHHQQQQQQQQQQQRGATKSSAKRHSDVPPTSSAFIDRHTKSVRAVFTTAFKLGILSPPDKQQYMLAGVRALSLAAQEGALSGASPQAAAEQHDLFLGAAGQVLLAVSRSMGSSTESAAQEALSNLGLLSPPSRLAGGDVISPFAHNWSPPKSAHASLVGTCLESLVNNRHYATALKVFELFFAPDGSAPNALKAMQPSMYEYESALRACVALGSGRGRIASSPDLDPVHLSKRLVDRMSKQFGAHVAPRQHQFPSVSYDVDEEAGLSRNSKDALETTKGGEEAGARTTAASSSSSSSSARRLDGGSGKKQQGGEKGMSSRAADSSSVAASATNDRNYTGTSRPGLPWSVIELHLSSLANGGDWEGCVRLFESLLLSSETNSVAVAAATTTAASGGVGGRLKLGANSSNDSGIQPSTNFSGKDYVGFEQHPFAQGDNWNFALCVGHVVNACVKAGHPSAAYLLCHRLGLLGADSSSLKGGEGSSSDDAAEGAHASSPLPSNESVSLLCCDYVLSGVMESLVLLKRGDSALTIFEAAVQQQQQRVENFVHPLDQLRAHPPLPGSFAWRAASGGRLYSVEPNITTWTESVLIATKALSDLGDLESAFALLRGLEVPANGNTKGLLHTYEALAKAYFDKSIQTTGPDQYARKVLEAYDLANVRVPNPYCQPGDYKYFGSATLSEYAVKSAAKGGKWTRVENICLQMCKQQSSKADPSAESPSSQPPHLWHEGWRPSDADTVLALCRSYEIRNKEEEGEHLLQVLVPRGAGLVNGKSFEAIFQTIGHSVRRTNCRGAPLVWDSSTASQSELDEFEQLRTDAYERLRRIKALSEKAGMGTDVHCVAGLARASRALRHPEDVKLLIENMIKKQVVPKATIFTHAIVGALESGNQELADKMIAKMEECGYEWQGSKPTPRTPQQKEKEAAPQPQSSSRNWRERREQGKNKKALDSEQRSKR